MRLTFFPDDDVDVRLGLDVATLRPLVAQITGRPELLHNVWWIGHRPLTPEQRAGVPPLVDGAVVTPLPPGIPAEVHAGVDLLTTAAASSWHLAIVAGPGAGWLLPPTGNTIKLGAAASRSLSGLPPSTTEVRQHRRGWTLRPTAVRRGESPLAIYRGRHFGKTWRRIYRPTRLRPRQRFRLGGVVLELRRRPTGIPEAGKAAISQPFWLLGAGTSVAMAVAMRNPVFLLFAILTAAVLGGGAWVRRRRGTAETTPAPAPAPVDPADLAAVLAAGVDWSDPPWQVNRTTHYGPGKAGRGRLYAQVGLILAMAVRDGRHPRFTTLAGPDPPAWSRWLPSGGGPDQVVILLEPTPAQLATAAQLGAQPGVVVHSAGPQRPSWCDDPGPDLPVVSAAWLAAIGRLTAGQATAARLPTQLALADVQPGVTGLVADPRRATFWLRRRWFTEEPHLRAVIGESLDGPFELDLCADGPHGIIAGTTGAGKSALVRTLLLSLASSRSPADLGIVTVDFKGGTSLGRVTELPHVVGRVDDTDPRTAARAIAGLRSELTSRARLLTSYGVTDLADLISLATLTADGRRILPSGDPCPPRLLVVVDEFRAVTEDLPDFVPDLIRLAAQGRSLGIHLILATQRPAGAVSAEIRANMSLRIGLRMLAQADSLDLLDVPDAANIDATTPGRAIIVTDHATTAVQVASTEVPTQPLVRRQEDAEQVPVAQASSSQVSPSRASSSQASSQQAPVTKPAFEDQLVQVIETVGASLRTPPLWAPVIPAEVTLPDLDKAAAGNVIPPGHLAVGLIDDIPARRWRILDWDPDVGGLLVLGKLAPSALGGIALAGARCGRTVHVIGPPALAAACPQNNLGTVVDLTEVARLVQLILRLRQTTGPGDLLLIADLAATAAELDRLAHQAATAFDDLLTDARRRRLAVAAAVGAQSLLTRSFGLRINLDEEPIPDRRVRQLGTGTADRHGWLIGEGKPVPCAILDDDPAASCPPPHSPLRIQPLPQLIEDLPAVPAGRLGIGIGGDDAGLVTLPMATLLVVGPPGSGRSSVLANLAAQAMSSHEVLHLTSTGWATGNRPSAIAANGSPDLSCPSNLTCPPESILIVDDLDDLPTHLGDVVTKHVAGGGIVFASARTDRVTSTYHGPLGAVRTFGRGVVLAPSTPGADHIFDVGLWSARDPVRERRPGYGAVVENRLVTGVVLPPVPQNVSKTTANPKNGVVKPLVEFPRT